MRGEKTSGSGNGGGNLIWRLLRKHVSPLQLAGFFVANLVGVAIILAAVQLWRDVRPAIEAPDSLMSADFVILSSDEGFTPAEMQDIDSQSFVAAVGAFTPARYAVNGGLSIMGMGFETWLFFESVPDRFLDVASEQWVFEPGDTTIPIILPRNYLNLYNFGFAATQGLPQVSEELVSHVPLHVTIGTGHHFEGRVVAFSNRLNTILVPESFIDWSNEQFADRPATSPRRIIIEAPNAADGALASYVSRHGYVVEGDKARAGRVGQLLRVATGVVGVVGVVIAALSVFILMLSIFLLLQKNSRKLQDLLLLGYTPAQVSRPYIVLIATLNALVVAGAFAVVVWARRLYLPMVATISTDWHPATPGITLLWGLAVALFVTILNAMAIRYKVNSLWGD